MVVRDLIAGGPLDFHPHLLGPKLLEITMLVVYSCFVLYMICRVVTLPRRGLSRPTVPIRQEGRFAIIAACKDQTF